MLHLINSNKSWLYVCVSLKEQVEKFLVVIMLAIKIFSIVIFSNTLEIN